MAPRDDAKLYQYTNIAKPDSIRLLELLPGIDELVRRNVVEVKLSQELGFDALSYTWGKNEFPHGLAEVSTHSSFYITDNLRSALHALSPDTGSHLLWVDVVCINQSDNVEKGWQVGIMKDIYQQASRVIIWLGPEPSKRVEAERDMAGFEKLERIGRNCTLYGFDKIFPPFPRQIASLEALEQLKKLAKDCNGLNVLYLYRREWYERVWTVQEFILAK
ncbi:heterokaryon incompatibility protein-domain-containing protein [Paraphoma chrysanthemicola]|nr:heterokaryon incompatibility protein-domain-containing protein [Paraphoma chrysanthemicola]